MLKLTKDFDDNNLLSWLTANSSVWLAAYISDKPFALSWDQLQQVAPKLATELKNAGISNSRMPESWLQNPHLLDARGAAVYNQNIPDAIVRFGPNAIQEFKHGKHWSHQISYKQGIQEGMSKSQLADANNGVFENATDNLRRGAHNMPEGWGNSQNPGKLQIQFFNELEAVQIVCKHLALNAAKGFVIGFVYELVLATLEQGLALARQEISLNQAVTVVLTKAGKMGLKGAIVAALITAVCAYIPGAGLILSTIAPILAAMATVISLKRVYDTLDHHQRVYDTLDHHLKEIGYPSPVYNIYKSAEAAINQAQKHLARNPLDWLGSSSASSQASIAEYTSLQKELDELLG